MDMFDFLLNVGVVTSALVAYLLIFKRSSPVKFIGSYRQPAWNYPLRLLCARYAVKLWKAKRPKSKLIEGPRESQDEGWDGITIRSSSPDGATILLAIRKLCERQPLAEVTVHVKLADGTTYKFPQHPDTLVGAWDSIPNGWSAGGLKIQLLEEEMRLRIIYNGLLHNVATNTTQHVKFNFIWTSATSIVRYPDDWSDSLAARALALEPWRDGKWVYLLDKGGDGSWSQWGTVQGRLQSFDDQGRVDKNVYLETRGVRERSWSPQGYQGLRRTITVTAAAKDGTLVQLKGFSYKDVLTLGFSGSVRFPNYAVKSITGTNLVMSNFCEYPEGIPKVYKINVSTSNRELTMILRIHEDGGKLLSGVPYQHEVYYRTMIVEINGYRGTGILELGYESSVNIKPSLRLTPTRTLKWLSEEQAGEVGYCLPFEAKAAACSNYVGGKGASLALLASVQEEQGYKVPPGYCLTTKALEKHLDVNNNLKVAIREIEAANENYDEKVFREKCSRAVELFAVAEIPEEVRNEILRHLADLRVKAAEQKLGPELRFAVRSSAVGEDSEALSAAGQNETILGCVSDADVLTGVQKCWGSMFAFTSAYYRRQNGQPCLCGGAVVVQALVAPRAAGVMFTRHPDAGDPSRLLITANYGLGESVVSGSVEPDTIVVSRGKDLKIAKIDLGSKSQRVTATGAGVTMEDVSEADRKTPCVTVSEILELARLGVAQEEMWGAGRDIEWAVTNDDIYLLQARPITSLERWSEEELLHELDFPIMSDDELITFANTGEVMPKALSALSYDLIYMPISTGMETLMINNGDGYDKTTVITHNRAALALYNTSYRQMPEKIDVTVRMLEMSVHGHKVCDDYIHSVSLHRSPPSRINSALVMSFMIKTLFLSKIKMNETIKIAKKVNFDMETEDVYKLLDIIEGSTKMMIKCSNNHGLTSTASIASQFIAMLVLVEGASDFTAEQSAEINNLLSSGGVLSAEVPERLGQIARDLDSSGKADEFRSQDPKLAMDWLKDNAPKVYKDVCLFLEQHGHRAVMEFDLVTKPWVLVPEEMMSVLQSMRPSKENKTVGNTNTKTDVIASLKTPKKSSTGKILRWLMPLCHRAVRHREGTKAHLILAIHKLRMVILRLANLLVRKWYLPDADLIFHFRLKELREYVETRDPAILKKALQRRQSHPAWSKLRFEEINTNWVRPIQEKGFAVTSGDVKVEATSVCGGEIIARACVVKDLSEIGQLQQGDILITHSTDIGWSPYFPLLTGIVTELGGLISHGAVIAREYGLPCIVGAAYATDIFKTGDTVRLSGASGVVERVQLEPPSEQES